MNFALFESMTTLDAHEHLRGFLDTERVAVANLIPLALHDGVPMDFSMSSLPAFLGWISRHLTIVRVPVPDSEPPWIREFHKDGFVDFTEQSKYMLLRAGYYLGETFVRSYVSLRWDVGKSDYIEKNMPVVSGFQSAREMAPVMICENIYAGILGDDEPESIIDIMLKCWSDSI